MYEVHATKRSSKGRRSSYDEQDKESDYDKRSRGTERRSDLMDKIQKPFLF